MIDQGVKFVTTSAGSPTKYTGVLKGAGLTVYHVVPTLQAALKAVEAGVDGLVVEGGEGGALKALLQCQRWCYYRSFVIMLTYPLSLPEE